MIMKSLCILLTVSAILTSHYVHSGKERPKTTFLSKGDFQLAQMLQFDEIEGLSTDTPFNDPELSQTYYEGDMMIKEDDEQRVAMYTAKRWPNGRIPYAMENKFSPPERAAIARGIMTLQERTCIKFVPKKSSDKDYVLMRRGPGCAAHVGRIGGQQWLFLGPGCYGLETVVHELMHSVGFIHEQSRPDRDAHVDIRWENIKEGAKRNFRKHTTDYLADHGFPYDLMSVMHYRQYAFSKNKKPTIIPRRRVPYLRCRGPECPSALDVRKINYLYKCRNGKSRYFGGKEGHFDDKHWDKDFFGGGGGPKGGHYKGGDNEFDNNVLIGEKFYEALPIEGHMDYGGEHGLDDYGFEDSEVSPVHSRGPCVGRMCYHDYDQMDSGLRLDASDIAVRLAPMDDMERQHRFWFNSYVNHK